MADVKQDWEFYPCQVDDHPASIFLNLGYAEHLPLTDSPTLLVIGLQMLEPGDHGIGVEPDVRTLFAAEDVIVAEAEARGLRFVGRVRHNGDWQLSFYGRPEHEPMLAEIALLGLGEQARGYRTASQDDPDWGYFRTFLMPNRERFQWIMNRRVVDQLRTHDDRLEEARPVDHYLEFPLDATLEPFIAQVEELGFTVVDAPAAQDGRLLVHLCRSDALDGLRIHGVVMELIHLATAAGGEYEGWGCTPVTD